MFVSALDWTRGRICLRKDLLDFNLVGAGSGSNSGCLGSVDWCSLSALLAVSPLISGGAIPASRCRLLVCQRNNRIPCWNAECKTFTKFLQYPEGHGSSRAATALLARLDRKRRNQWSEAVQNFDFSHSSMEYVKESY